MKTNALGSPKNDTPRNLLEFLSWFIGSGMDQETIDVLAEGDRAQKAMITDTGSHYPSRITVR